MASLSERFWKKVEKTDSCWEWIACKQNKGYGQIRIDGLTLLAHRVCWGMTYGSIPADLCVLHKCDNPACVNPEHLFLGTVADNNRDMYKKGRNNTLRGEQVYNAKLTNREAIEIRNSNLTCQALADRFGVSNNTVSAIKRGKRYAI